MTEIVLNANNELYVSSDTDRTLSDLRFEQDGAFVCISGMSYAQLLKVAMTLEDLIETLEEYGAASGKDCNG